MVHECEDPNPTFCLPAMPSCTFNLSTLCHDVGMRAYFKWKGFSQERAEQEYDKAYFATLRKNSPNHPHLKYAPENL